MFDLKGEQRILLWRDFRVKLNSWPEDIETVCKFWSKAPLVNNYLTYDNVAEWPDAWTLLNDGLFCDISIALGIFYTLYYSSYSLKDQMQLQHYHCVDQHKYLNLVSLEGGKYMLNYHHDRSVNILSIKDLPDPKLILTSKDLPIK